MARINTEVLGADEADKALTELAKQFPAAAYRGVMKGAIVVQGSAKSEFIRTQGESYVTRTGKTRYRALGAPVADKLTSRTGALRASIRVVGDEASASAYVGPAVVYGRIHEFGGDISIAAHSRLATLAGRRQKVKAAVYNIRTHKRRMATIGKRLNIYSVAEHEVAARTMHIPARPYLRPAYYAHQAEVREKVVGELRDIIRRLNR